MKKNTFKVLMEATIMNKLPEFPNTRKYRTIQKEELQKMLKEEFEEAKKVEDVKVNEDGWENVELEKEMKWASTLKLEKAFKK